MRSEPALSTVPHTCPVGTLAPTASTVCSATYLVAQSDVDAGFIDNTGTVGGATLTAGPVSEHSDLRVVLTQAPALSLTKTSDDANYTSVGQLVHYTYSLTNSGNVTLLAPSVTDTNTDAPPSYFDGDNGNGKLDVGEAWIFKAVHTVTIIDIDSGHISNAATGHATFKGNQVDSDTVTGPSTPTPPTSA